MSQFLLHRDDLTGTTDYFVWDEASESFTIKTEFDATSLIEANRAEFNEGGKFGEMRRVASIPLNLYSDLKQKGIVDDQKAFRAWLNDRDNRFFRTFPGVI